MRLRELLENGFEFVKGAPTDRKIYRPIAADHVLEDNFAGKSMKPGASYFQMTLSEMFMKDRREYWKNYRPFVLTLV